MFSAYKLDKLLSSIQRSGDYEFTNANRIYVDKDIQVRSCIPPLFEDELQTQDFQNAPDVSRRNINSWVEERTHNMIKDILPPGSIDSQTNLVLANAAYFKGLWENKFDAANTKLDVFHISPSNRTIVDMMNVQGSFNFGKFLVDSFKICWLYLLCYRYLGGIGRSHSGVALQRR